jgi:hypothetical protein
MINVEDLNLEKKIFFFVGKLKKSFEKQILF